MKSRYPISRRSALRGLGVSIALPWLEAMQPPARAAMSAGAGAAPVRLAYVYVPNGVHMPSWTPTESGSSFQADRTLGPLAPFRDDLLVLSGLALDPARAHGDGGGDHARAMSAFLTGKHPRKTDGSDLRAGISVDQVAAARVGRATRFASLELGCEGGRGAGACDHGYSCAYQSNLSWRSETSPVAKEINPRLAFDRLFGDGRRPGDDADRAARDRGTRSVLDFAAEDARRLRGGLGAADRRKLDEYLDDVRGVERRVAGPRPEAGRDSGGVARPDGIPAEYRDHVRLMADILVLAFRSDLTRVATLVFANDGSNRTYRDVGVLDGHHDTSHHGQSPEKQAKLAAINRFHVEQFAYLVGRLRSAREAGGSLLDQSMIVYGSGISDGDSHRHDDLPILVAGRGGGTLRPGRHVRYPADTPLANLHLAMLDRLGVPLPKFGDSTGQLDQLLGP